MGGENKPDFTSLETMARMAGINIGVRDLVNDWLLLTYYLPHSKAGDIARRRFLMRARSIGATYHTDSVYLMPWTPEAEALALQLAQIGNVFVWTSRTTEPARAAEITRSYDENIKPLLDLVEERIERIKEHLLNNRQKRAHKMIEKTDKMLTGLEQAIVRRGSANLFIRACLLRQMLNLL